jgi:hypothetical protein
MEAGFEHNQLLLLHREWNSVAGNVGIGSMAIVIQTQGERPHNGSRVITTNDFTAIHLETVHQPFTGTNGNTRYTPCELR